jgi:hypothetical protein
VKKSPADERRSPRAKVLLAGFLESGNLRIPVRIRNLSEHGVLVVGKVPLPEDAHVTLGCNGQAVQGWIAWVADESAGIHFGEPNRADDLLPSAGFSPQPITKDTRVSDFRRPGFRGNQLTSAEREILREWASTQG